MTADFENLDPDTMAQLTTGAYTEIAEALRALPEALELPQPDADDALSALIDARATLRRIAPKTILRGSVLEAMLLWASAVNLLGIERDPSGSSDYLLEAAASQLVRATRIAQAIRNVRLRGEQ